MSADARGEHRAGVAAILGRPNAGKSTLLNQLLGEKLAIVTQKPQTTRSRILGIHTRERAQVLLVDTPGLHEGEKSLNLALNAQVWQAAEDCDVALLLVDPLDRGGRGGPGAFGEDHRALLERLRACGTPVLLVGTKSDLWEEGEGQWPPGAPGPDCRVSARTGEGVDALLDAVVERLPASPPFYPGDEISDRPLRWLAAEEIREAAFSQLEQELPYSLAVEVVSFDESRDDLVKIRANLLVERESQKQIVIGRGGERVKAIGTAARPPIEHLVGCKVYLELRVKVEPKWSKRPRRLQELGYG